MSFTSRSYAACAEHLDEAVRHVLGDEARRVEIRKVPADDERFRCSHGVHADYFVTEQEPALYDESRAASHVAAYLASKPEWEAGDLDEVADILRRAGLLIGPRLRPATPR